VREIRTPGSVRGAPGNRCPYLDVPINMEEPEHDCPCCGAPMAQAEAALNRPWINAVIFGFGSSELQIRKKGGSWIPFMNQWKSAEASYCLGCGALLIAPTISEHRKRLKLDKPKTEKNPKSSSNKGEMDPEDEVDPRTTLTRKESRAFDDWITNRPEFWVRNHVDQVALFRDAQRAGEIGKEGTTKRGR